MSVTTRSVTRCWSKSSQNVSKSCPKKVATAVYTLKWMFPKQPKQSTHNWATFVTKNVTQNIQNCPIRSHWSQVKQKQKKNNNTFEKLLRLIWSYEFSRETSTNDVLFLHFCQHQEIGKRKKIKKSFGYFLEIKSDGQSRRLRKLRYQKSCGQSFCDQSYKRFTIVNYDSWVVARTWPIL